MPVPTTQWVNDRETATEYTRTTVQGDTRTTVQGDTRVANNSDDVVPHTTSWVEEYA